MYKVDYLNFEATGEEKLNDLNCIAMIRDV